MKIGVFVPSDNQLHADALSAFAEGIKSCGHFPEIRHVEDYAPVDIAVVFGVGKKNVPCSYARGRVIAGQEKNGGTTIIIEKGFVLSNTSFID